VKYTAYGNRLKVKYTAYGNRLSKVRRAVLYIFSYASGFSAARSNAASSSRINSAPNPIRCDVYHRAARLESSAAPGSICTSFNCYVGSPEVLL